MARPGERAGSRMLAGYRAFSQPLGPMPDQELPASLSAGAAASRNIPGVRPYFCNRR